MISSAIRFVTLAMFLAALVAAAPVIPALAAGGGGGGGSDPYASSYPSTTPPSAGTKATGTTQKGKKKTDRQSSLFDNPAFAQGYRAAHATIYDRHDYAGASSN